MKIFTSKDSEFWGSKINFVDNNNVLVGFSDVQNCCENYGYFLTKKPIQRPPGEDYNSRYEFKPEEISESELKDYNFDVDYFKELSNKELYTDDGGAVAFRLISSSGEEAFLTLYNVQNGYYSHGFSFKNNNEIIKEGSL